MIVVSIKNMLSTRTRKSCFAISLSLVAAMAGFAWGIPKKGATSECGKARTFLWVEDATEGIALTYAVSEEREHHVSKPETDLRIVVTQKPELAEHWEIGEAAAYYWEGGKRRKAIVEGPYPSQLNETTRGGSRSTWTLHHVKNRKYEVDLLLHKIKDGMPPKEVAKAISEQDALEICIDPLSSKPNEPIAYLPGAGWRE